MKKLTLPNKAACLFLILSVVLFLLAFNELFATGPLIGWEWLLGPLIFLKGACQTSMEARELLIIWSNIFLAGTMWFSLLYLFVWSAYQSLQHAMKFFILAAWLVIGAYWYCLFLA